jgi:hypothetical protein
MNLELIKNYVEAISGQVEVGHIVKEIRDAKKELELIKRSLNSGIALMVRTGSDEGLQEAYTDLDAFLNPEIFEPTHSSDPIVQASIITRNKALSDGMATIDADGEVTYSND